MSCDSSAFSISMGYRFHHRYIPTTWFPFDMDRTFWTTFHGLRSLWFNLAIHSTSMPFEIFFSVFAGCEQSSNRLVSGWPGRGELSDINLSCTKLCKCTETALPLSNLVVLQIGSHLMVILSDPRSLFSNSCTFSVDKFFAAPLLTRVELKFQ